jgi:hypothetical protein
VGAGTGGGGAGGSDGPAPLIGLGVSSMDGDEQTGVSLLIWYVRASFFAMLAGGWFGVWLCEVRAWGAGCGLRMCVCVCMCARVCVFGHNPYRTPRKCSHCICAGFFRPYCARFVASASCVLRSVSGLVRTKNDSDFFTPWGFPYGGSVSHTAPSGPEEEGGAPVGAASGETPAATAGGPFVEETSPEKQRPCVPAYPPSALCLLFLEAV